MTGINIEIPQQPDISLEEYMRNDMWELGVRTLNQVANPDQWDADRLESRRRWVHTFKKMARGE